jgi:cytochrome P450
MSIDQTSTAGEVTWDPFDHALHADSHPTWRRMREEAPLYRNEQFDFWALTRFDDVLAALVDWKTYSSAKGNVIETIQAGIDPNEYAQSLITMDPPAHTVHRHLLSRTFTPRAIKTIEDRVRAFARGLLEERVGTTRFDFVEDYGALIPSLVIATMLGTPDSDIPEIRRLTDSQFHLDEDQDPNDRSTFDAATDRLGEYFMEHVHRRRKNPSDDMMSMLVTMEFTDEDGSTRRLTDLEACQYIFVLSAAGNDTVARFSGWAGSVLAEHPGERAKLVARPELIPNAVEEILRYEPPSMALARHVTADVEWYGQVVPAGSVMVLVTAATGRDQRVFPDPDVLDVERRIERHLSFGFGTHVCLGASLARAEARIMVDEMLQRFPEWDVEWDDVEVTHMGSALRGYQNLPIRLA